MALPLQASFGVNTAQASSAAAIQAQVATTNTLTLSVVSAADGVTPVANYKYMINIDNTGTTVQRSPAPGSGCNPADAGYPASCNWVSIAGAKGSSPIFTQGDQSDFAAGGINLPNGHYLISVLADGYKIDGAHFTIPGPGLVTVQMQPYDLPDATIQAEVFEDVAPTNSAPDVPAERGIAGFVGHIKDYLGEVTTDVYGAPLCGNGQCVSKCYVVDGGVDVGIVSPIDAAGRCPMRGELPANATTIDTNAPISATAVIEGKVKIPNVGPNRYALSVVPPNQSGWVQTTTLEGNHDWDAWVMEGATGLDTEFVVAGEPFPAIFFGYVKQTAPISGGTGEIKGTAVAVSAYIPPTGGITGELGLLGAKPKAKNPIHSLYVSLSDLNNNDQTVYMGHFTCNEANGCPPISFDIPNVPDGDYVLGVWDEPQDYIFLEQNVSIKNGELADLGTLSLMGWWATIEGHVFNDLNSNGKMDPGEPGIPNFLITMRKRENSLMDRGTTSITTDANGYYWMESAYPMTQWLVEEAYADGFQTTGVTYQADNQPTETTVLGQGVDVNVLPIIGLGGRLDWGVKAYDPGTNGGIVGTVSYDTTRNELNPAYSAIEDWQPSIPDMKVDLYAPVACPIDPNTGQPTAPCDPTGLYQLAPDGSYLKGDLLNQYVSETWDQPTGCIARNVDGNPLVHGIDENVLPTDPNAPCLEGPLMGMQFSPMATDVGTPLENFGASVNGNYGFGDGCFVDNGGVLTPGVFDPTSGACSTGALLSLPSNRDYLVQVEIPTEAAVYGVTAAHPDRPMYQVTKEEDINIGNGDSFVSQVPPPACAGPLHTVDVAGLGTDGYGPVDVFGDGSVVVPASTPVNNPTFAGIGGSPYEGMQKPLCDMKLVHVSDRKSIAPGFNLFTDVPLPGRFWGLIVDDLNFSSNPQSLAYGEKMGVPFAPVGIYDYTNRLIYTAESDYNGLFDVLLPSTNRINCPTPSGVCANLYRFVGNDPGIPGRWNTNYSPQYRTIAAEFEAFPGLIVPADLAPTQVAVAVQIPGVQTLTPIACMLPATSPQFFTINKPYMYTNSSAADRTFTITGLGFGAAVGRIQIGTVSVPVTAGNWSDRQITFTVPTGALGPNPYQLKIVTAGGTSAINALTFHVLSPGGGGGGGVYNPAVFEVGPGKPYATIQSALEAAAPSAKALVVVYPALPDYTNPRYNGRGAYYENIVIHSPVKLQGVGPGGVYPDGTPVQGSIIDGSAFGGDTALADAWRTLVSGLTWDGNQDVYDGEVVYILAHAGQFTSGYQAAIDGLDVRGGDQMGFPGNLNAIFGGYPGPLAAGVAETQGGAIFANAYASYLRITNNIIEGNGGAYGAIRLGTPNIAAPASSQHNDHVLIGNNRILANAGTNLAGAIGLFNGSDNYEIANNDLCGNFSAEYGGAISHFGLSPNGRIHDNRIYFNRSYDEGAGIMVAGELATNSAAAYGQTGGPQGSGAVDIYNNLIQANLSDDDGGGVRFLMAGNFPMNVYNNMIANNVSTHEGGGVAIDDAPDVRFYNNTVMKNITTATSLLSDGLPAPAGLSTGANSDQLQQSLAAGAPLFSNPLLFNNVFWDNRAGTRGTNMVTGIGAAGDALPINYWDMGVMGGLGLLSPTNSIAQSTQGTDLGAPGADPQVADSNFNVGLTFTSWRTNVNFIGAIMVTADLPPNLMGNYHLASNASPAYNNGAAAKASTSAPIFDIDNEGRPAFGAYDIGADEIPVATADLSITNTDGVTTVPQGSPVQYSIVVSNTGPQAANGATVTDNVPAALSGVTWTCVSSSGGASCGVASGSGNAISVALNLPAGSAVLITVNGVLSATATGPLVNTASVAAPAGTLDPVAGNNSATDSDAIVPAMHVGDLDVVTANTSATAWSASVTVAVHNASHAPLGGVTVTGSWNAGSGGSSACTTASSGSALGTCTVTRSLSKSTNPAVTFTVSSLTRTSWGYLASANHDPDGDSNGTAITATPAVMHVGALTSTASRSSTAWQTTVTITVVDANNAPVSGAIVTGAWTNGSGSGSGGTTCATNASGQCTVTRTGISLTRASMVFAVSGVTKASGAPAIVYQAGPITSITVNRP